MPRVRLKLKPPFERLARFSSDRPNDEFRILSARPTDEGLLSVLEAEVSDPDAIVRHFDESPDMRSYEVLQIDRGALMIQYVLSEPEPHRVARLAGTLAEFPLIVRDGWIFVELTTSHERLSEFTSGLEAADIAFEILSITQSIDVMDLLTDRQWQFTTEAIERGYYDSPRECSVVDLAEALDVSQSTASGILHRAEGRVIKQFVGRSPLG
ncbi:helix-turn-helix domain-containing protein [Halosolutus gelatinilyticus]|uniref:helix-turn-helix domain-containing protein n=1 Tax=Halosolutus gelatinilyticus TaxID=2931975 RepID=UPI001FF4FDA4|nr:helix-turn-helix domain-containing protein [Halosolutus gelatinilyticus]